MTESPDKVKMVNDPTVKECAPTPKRSLTPNRSLYSSFGEAHRNIAPPTPKLPFEADVEQLTPEQVEHLLKDTSQPEGTGSSKDPISHFKQEHPVIAGPSHSNTEPDSLPSPGFMPRMKTIDQALPETVSPLNSDDEHAFIDHSVSSASDQDKANTIGQDDPFENQNATFYPDTSSFYPEDGADYSPDDTDDLFPLEKINTGPHRSPVLASLPPLPPPPALSPQDPALQLTQSHFDDVTKKQMGFSAIHTPGYNGTHTDTGFASATSQYDADVSNSSVAPFTPEDKGKTSVSCLNPFHAFSAASSHESDMHYEQPESQSQTQKVLMRARAEKEVSRALHHATGLSQPSSGLIIGRTRPSHTSSVQDSPYKSSTAQQATDFYHAPAIQDSWKIDKSGVKVKVSGPAQHPISRIDEMNMQETEMYDTIDNHHMVSMAQTDERATQDMDEDWRTVTDNQEDYQGGAIGRVMTGSSIANVSDAYLIRQNEATPVPSVTTAWWQNNATVSRPPIPSPSHPFPVVPSMPSSPPPVATRQQRRQEGWEEIELEDMRPISQHHAGDFEQAGRQQYANLPFTLVNREDAAKRQAVRRASGLEDQTLSGRVTSPGMRAVSTQSSCYNIPRTAPRKNSARSLFPRIKNPNFDCRAIEIRAEHQNPFNRPEHEFYSTELARGRESASNTDSLALGQPGRPSSPHIYPRDVRTRFDVFQAVRGVGGRGTDSELGDMAATAGDLPLAEWALVRQKKFYVGVMAATVLFPLVGYLILSWNADRIIGQVTHGECSGLSFEQRRKLRVALLVGCAVWSVALLAGLIALVASRP